MVRVAAGSGELVVMVGVLVVAAIVMLKLLFVEKGVGDVLSATMALIVKGPGTLAVPVIAPVEELIDSPVGMPLAFQT